MSPYADPRKKREWALARWHRNRTAGIEHLGGKCVKCGTTEKLEIDHIDPATKVASEIWSWSLERRLAELAKCQLLCNDHHKVKSLEDMRRRLEAQPRREPPTRTKRFDPYEVFS
jgi:5-methylcytosine-specific restriction endonuclease McrA